MSKSRLGLFVKFVKKNTVFCIAFILAVITCFIVHPDSEYVGYFDFRTLTCLFCTLATVCALKNINFFRVMAEKVVCIFKKTRYAVVALVYITFIGSMLIANDMALITFLPLGYFVLTSTGNKKFMSFTFIMQNIAANLGGMLTPFGNPQNLYMYSYFDIETIEFVQIMFLPFIVSIALITLCCLRIPKDDLVIESKVDTKFCLWRTVIYLVLFAFSIMIVFRAIPYYIGLVIIPLSLLLLDRKALRDVDYSLLLTFCAFFIFAGNLSRINCIRDVLGWLVNKNTLLFGTLSCQFISNVPSAILLSRFTENYPQLLVAVNIGGAGTLIASLASLITFREFCKNEPCAKKQYIKEFSIYNFGILTILLIMMLIVFNV